MPSGQRGRSRGPVDLVADENDAYNRSSKSNPVVSAFEARRRRKQRVSNGNNYPSSSDYGYENNDPAQNSESSSRKGRKGRRSKSGKELPTDDADPYDSDPGESYREHCERIQEERTKSCLAIPRFLKDGKFMHKNSSVGNAPHGVKVFHSGGKQRIGHDDVSGFTQPPSPMISEAESKNMPASLPTDLARVRYSLRTSIGDGTEKQPGGSAAMMERRELRPNNIHINVSHWSDFGGRNYMEDR